MDPVELRQLIDRELKQLPLPHAPATLLPRVLAAAGESLLPWYRRPWLAWPAVWQAASAALLALVVAGLLVLISDVQPVTAVLRRANEAAALVNLVSQLVLQPIAMYLFALAMSLTVACAALWSALNRAALGGPSWR